MQTRVIRAARAPPSGYGFHEADLYGGDCQAVAELETMGRVMGPLPTPYPSATITVLDSSIGGTPTQAADPLTVPPMTEQPVAPPDSAAPAGTRWARSAAGFGVRRCAPWRRRSLSEAIKTAIDADTYTRQASELAAQTDAADKAGDAATVRDLSGSRQAVFTGGSPGPDQNRGTWR